MRARGFVALVALAALLCPSAGAAVVAIHLLADHHEEAGAHDAELAASLHGHHHPRGTPEHGHAFVSPAPAFGAVRSHEGIATAPAVPLTAQAELAALIDTAGHAALARSGDHGPPPPVAFRIVLRV